MYRRNSDSYIRELERRSLAGDIEAESKLLTEYMRIGKIKRKHVMIAAHLGYVPATMIFPKIFQWDYKNSNHREIIFRKIDPLILIQLAYFFLKEIAIFHNYEEIPEIAQFLSIVEEFLNETKNAESLKVINAQDWETLYALGGIQLTNLIQGDKKLNAFINALLNLNWFIKEIAEITPWMRPISKLFYYCHIASDLASYDLQLNYLLNLLLTH